MKEHDFHQKDGVKADTAVALIWAFEDRHRMRKMTSTT